MGPACEFALISGPIVPSLSLHVRPVSPRKKSLMGSGASRHMRAAYGRVTLLVTVLPTRLAGDTLLVAGKALFLEVAVESLENGPPYLLTHVALEQ